MSDNIPSEIQEKIMKMLPIKPLIQFRSVSKPWKYLIDSSKFITDYHILHNTKPHHHLLVQYEDVNSEQRYVSFLDDDTFPQQKLSLNVPMTVNQLYKPMIVGSSQGLLCFYSYDLRPSYAETKTAVIWNPTIRKSVDVVVPNVLDYGPYKTVVGFGVCPDTNDVKLVKLSHIICPMSTGTAFDIPNQVEVFTLSSGVWRVPAVSFPRKSIVFMPHNQVVIEGFIYFLCTDYYTVDDVKDEWSKLIMSFDMTSDEFTEVSLPDCLAKEHSIDCFISKRGESLVVVKCSYDTLKLVYGVWMMEDGVQRSFTKLFTIDTPGASISKVLGFRESGEAILEMINDTVYGKFALCVYEPNSKDTNYIGISRRGRSSSAASSYIESMLLLDH